MSIGFGSYSKANAHLYTDLKRDKLRITNLGNPDYVNKVIQYIGLEFGSVRNEPNFETYKAWGFSNPYSRVDLYG